MFLFYKDYFLAILYVFKICTIYRETGALKLQNSLKNGILADLALNLKNLPIAYISHSIILYLEYLKCF